MTLKTNEVITMCAAPVGNVHLAVRAPNMWTQRAGLCGVCFRSRSRAVPPRRLQQDLGLFLLRNWAPAAFLSSAGAPLLAARLLAGVPSPLIAGLHIPSSQSAPQAVKRQVQAKDEGNDTGSCSHTNKHRGEKYGWEPKTRMQQRK